MQRLPLYRVVVFVPPPALDAVKQGILAVDALAGGGYEHGMWWSAPGFEQFRPRVGASPAQGEAGRTEVVASVRLEFCLPRDAQRLQRMFEQGIAPHHPWQVPVVQVEEVELLLADARLL
ncbi:hypothetical protein D7U89_07575 [Stenotrophomonas maltophilia]|uniref:hypothetical protein n=1 Tax=Stenotrophomonas TaxID=40323 RepID=UPI000D4CFCEE|nr:hypothetical protein [Stenotrophomonas maltophilia]MBA0225349.1 hypothetical protein [Stenotrophomonas maltophilia]MBA0365469.1 hypothetical protein [Stenotrophomonas maltophilia]MBA0403276.1 hypothetical protein [Stenotrophomonas maltophilia]MCF3520683.1 hypothetical protein [Stenotrophomonas maltophilia]PSD19297.1 hypothetical protein C7E14_02795 [Stenotrophomonas maltophilia]